VKAGEKQPGRTVLTREETLLATSAETSAEMLVRDQLTELILCPSQCRKVVVAQELSIEVESEEVAEELSQDEAQDDIPALLEWELVLASRLDRVLHLLRCSCEVREP